jgi:hypothetical protein
MAQALTPGHRPARRRAFFGLLDADGWGWASVKAFAWFLLIIFVIGYIPDRAYYFTVSRTIDVGLIAFAPVNICPAENEGLECPAPRGAIRPWHPAPPELTLPAARMDGGLVQAGTQLLYIGGSDGTTASADVFVAPVVAGTNFDRWEAGPALPEPRANAGIAFFNGSIYVVGGVDADGAPSTTTFILTPDTEAGDLGEWTSATELDLPLELPEPRAGSSLLALPDGLLLVGGTDGTSATSTSWMATLDGEVLGEWTPTAQQLHTAVTDAVGVVVGSYVWVYGGTDATGTPTGAVQRGTLGGGADDEGQLTEWGVRPVGNLPEARTNATGFEASGALYLIGGYDAAGQPRSEVFWAVPADGGGDLGEIVGEWNRLERTDLPPQGLAGSAGLASGAAFLVGGTTTDGVTAGAARANLSPEEPLFRLGLFGATIPALQIEGEVGQQIGYLNAMSVGMLNFALLVVVGVAMAHKEQTRALFRRFRRRRA